MSLIGCPHCQTQSNHGVRVCVGCQAEVVYGATDSEQNTYLGGGIIVGAIAQYFILNSIGISLGFWWYLIGAGAGVVIGGMLMNWVHAGKIRFFRNYTKK